MTLTLHPEAAANFNKKAEEILLMVVVAPQSNKERPFPSQLFIEHSIVAEEVVGGMRHAEVDFKGDEVSRYFDADGRRIGLIKENYASFETLCRSILKSPDLINAISLRSVKDTAFEWVELRYKGQNVQLLIDFMLPRLESIIRKLEIWVPVYGTEIETSFSIGHVVFQPITKALVDTWVEESTRDRAAEEAERRKQFIENERRKIQGFAVGTMVFDADPVRAGEIAVYEVERALNLLRFYEPTNLHPGISSHCTILGKQHLQSTKFYQIQGGLVVGSSHSMIDKGSPYWQIEKNFLMAIKDEGLDKLSSILLSKNPSDFQMLIVDTLQIYSRMGLAKTYSDKLVYLLVTLESLLLRGNSESIQQNVGERLAFALEKRPNERKRIVRNFKEVYGMRSDFVHHGNDVEPEQVYALTEFMANAWTFLRLVIRNADNFRSKSDMIDAIDNIKFS